jgi:hypothetical protein
MLEELKQKIEIFKRQEIDLVSRQELHAIDLNLPHEWLKLLRNKSLTTSQIIEYLWEPVASKAQKIIKVLTSRVVDITVVSPLNKESPVEICYLFQVASLKFQRTYLNGWVAGQPLQKVDLLEDKSELLLPSTYREFCNIHNGFLHNGNGSIGFLPVERLQVVRSEDRHTIMLEFCGDGLGNTRCFDLSKPINEKDFTTVDLDHETLEVDHPLPFWDFASQFIDKNIKPL